MAFVIGVFLVMTASVAPIYYTSRTAQKFDEAANRSYLVLSFTEDREKVDAIAFGIGVTLSVCSFVAVAICTAVLVFSLKKTSKWRESVATSGKAQGEKTPARLHVEASEVESSEVSTKTFSSVASLSADVAEKDNHRAAPNGSSTAADMKKRKAKEAASAKNKRASKMVSLISTIFIVCYLPNTLNQLVSAMIYTMIMSSLCYHTGISQTYAKM